MKFIATMSAIRAGIRIHKVIVPPDARFFPGARLNTIERAGSPRPEGESQ